MQIRELKQVRDFYKTESSLRRRLFPSPAIKRLNDLYDEYEKKKELIPHEVLRNALANHWAEVKNTPRDYLQQDKKATEKAYILLANLLDQPTQSCDSEIKKQTSYVRIATLMPAFTLSQNPQPDIPSMTEHLDISQPRTLVGKYAFQYQTWIEELREEKLLEKQNDLFNYLIQKYDVETLSQLEQNLSALKIPSAEKVKSELTFVTEAVKEAISYLKESKGCVNMKVGDVFVKNIPGQYFFMTHDKIGFDIRSLFLINYINPVTKKPLDADMGRLGNHPLLGSLINDFRSKKDIFVYPRADGYKSWLQELDDGVALDDFLYYSHFYKLDQLFKHIDESFLKSQTGLASPELIEQFRKFKVTNTNTRSQVLWSEMDDRTFFSKADEVIRKTSRKMRRRYELGDFSDDKASQLFSIIRVWATIPAHYIQYHHVGSFLTPTESERTKTVERFRMAFEVAYRCEKLETLIKQMADHLKYLEVTGGEMVDHESFKLTNACNAAKLVEDIASRFGCSDSTAHAFIDRERKATLRY